jgi:hypothetical protein
MKQGTRITCAVCWFYEVRKKLCNPAPLVMSLRKSESMIRTRSVKTQACIGETLHVLRSHKSIKSSVIWFYTQTAPKSSEL